MNKPLIATGDFLFGHRNWVFPALIACVFAIGVPPSQTFGSEALEHVKDIAGVCIALAGLTLRGLVIGQRYVQRSGVKKTIQADELFTSGVFSLCRNPLYTGNILILTGIFLVHGNPFAIVVGTALFVFIYRAIVAAEENYLTLRFGAVYATYCSQVPRWLPNLLRLAIVMRSQPFRLSRALIVEYTNIGLTVGALALVELYEQLGKPFERGARSETTILLAVIAAAIVWIASMRFLKKKQILTTS